MKIIKKVIAILLILTTMTGCVKSRTEMTINNDKSMVFESSYLVSDKLLEYNDESNDEVFSSEELNLLKKRNITYEKKTDNGYTGYLMKKVYNNIDDISNETGKEVELSEYFSEDFDETVFFKVEKGFLKNKYTANFKYNLKLNNDTNGGLSFDTQNTINDNKVSIETTDNGNTVIPSNDTTVGNTTTNDNKVTTPGNKTNVDDTTISGEDDDTSIPGTDEPDYSDLMGLASEMEITYTVNLPEKAINNNATNTENDGKKLTWKLTTQSDNKIEYVFEIKNMTNYYILYGGIAAGVVIVILIIIMIIKKGKKGKEVIPAQNEPIHADYDPSIAAAIPNPALVNGGPTREVNNEVASTTTVTEQQPTQTVQQTPVQTETPTEPKTEMEEPVQQPVEESVSGPIGNTNTEPQAHIIPEVTVEPQVVVPETIPTFVTPDNTKEEPIVIPEEKPEIKIDTPQTIDMNQN